MSPIFDHEWREKIIASFEADREDTLDELKQILSFPFHPDTRLVMFELHGNGGVFGLNPWPMKDGDYHIDIDASGTPLYQTGFDEFGCGFSAYDQLDEVNRMSPEEIGDLDDLAIDYLCDWFADLLHELNADLPISYAIQRHDYTGVYSVPEKEWLTDAEFDSRFEDGEG
ncbi:hypothetical protein [Nocardia brevicatena]|uniref:hypothetical protein n=1 Tax=Nocardia brevicatena TaxID=37327 RepID=UPI0002E1B7E2|nr:hypothetical protein [Nocardia brevicatena]